MSAGLPYLFGIVAFIVTTFLAWSGLLNTRNIARTRASSDLLHSMLKDMRLDDACVTVSLVNKSESVDLIDFSGTKENDTTKAWLGSDENPFKQKEKVRYIDVVDDIQHLLCYYDFIASGIKREVYDEEVLRDSLYSRVTQYATVLKEFIEKRREIAKQATLWQDFQALAVRWERLGPPPKPEADDFEINGYFERKFYSLEAKLKKLENNRRRKERSVLDGL